MSKRNLSILVVVVAVAVIAVAWYYNSSISGAATTPRSTCIDSDSGIAEQQFFEKGYIIYGGQVINDTCMGNTLIEAYCKKTITGRFKGAVERYTCRDGCENGECIYGEIEKTVPR